MEFQARTKSRQMKHTVVLFSQQNKKDLLEEGYLKTLLFYDHLAMPNRIMKRITKLKWNSRLTVSLYYVWLGRTVLINLSYLQN